MEVFRPDVKAGVFILIGGALFIWALFKVGGVLATFQDQRELVMDFANAQQVREGTEIFQRGMKIGSVTRVGLGPGGDRIQIVAEVNPRAKLVRGTKARIDNKSLLGGKMIELIPPIEGPFEDLGADDIVPGMPPSDMAQMMQAAADLLPAIKDSLDQLTKKLMGTMGQMDETMIVLRKRMEVVDDLKPDVVSTLEAYRNLALNADKQIADLSAKLVEVADGVDPMLDGIKADISKLTDELGEDLAELTAKVSVLVDDSGKLVRDVDNVLLSNQDELTGTLQALEGTMRNLESLTATLADKPSALVWGKGKKSNADTGAQDRERADRELRESGYITRKPAAGGNQ
ncbi:MAG: MlaD family protein [Acidobacteriota bacterium]|nr:MlaD family protein [Acidobacteriota bacterium]